jgi:hypothetical protein
MVKETLKTKETSKTIKKKVKDALIKNHRGLSVRQLYDEIKPQKRFSVEKALLELMDANEVRLDRFDSQSIAIYAVKKPPLGKKKKNDQPKRQKKTV